jgi:hypothetical protein
MKLLSAQVWVFVVLGILAVPYLGSMADHHFAERQPAHRHAGTTSQHHHDHGYDHDHAHGAAAGPGGQPVAVYDFESGSAATVVVVVDDMAMQRFLLFEPTSRFSVTLPGQVPAQGTLVSPPDKPPQNIL